MDTQSWGQRVGRTSKRPPRPQDQGTPNHNGSRARSRADGQDGYFDGYATDTPTRHPLHGQDGEPRIPMHEHHEMERQQRGRSMSRQNCADYGTHPDEDVAPPPEIRRGRHAQGHGTYYNQRPYKHQQHQDGVRDGTARSSKQPQSHRSNGARVVDQNSPFIYTQTPSEHDDVHYISSRQNPLKPSSPTNIPDGEPCPNVGEYGDRFSYHDASGANNSCPNHEPGYLHSAQPNFHGYHDEKFDLQGHPQEDHEVDAKNFCASRTDYNPDFSLHHPHPHAYPYPQGYPQPSFDFTNSHQCPSHAADQVLGKGIKSCLSYHNQPFGLPQRMNGLDNVPPDDQKPFTPRSSSGAKAFCPSASGATFHPRSVASNRHVRQPVSILKRKHSPRYLAQVAQRQDHHSGPQSRPVPQGVPLPYPYSSQPLSHHNDVSNPSQPNRPHQHTASRSPPCSCSTLSTPESHDSQPFTMLPVKREFGSGDRGMPNPFGGLRSGATYDLVSDDESDFRVPRAPSRTQAASSSTTAAGSKSRKATLTSLSSVTGRPNGAGARPHWGANGSNTIELSPDGEDDDRRGSAYQPKTHKDQRQLHRSASSRPQDGIRSDVPGRASSTFRTSFLNSIKPNNNGVSTHRPSESPSNRVVQRPNHQTMSSNDPSARTGFLNSQVDGSSLFKAKRKNAEQASDLFHVPEKRPSKTVKPIGGSGYFFDSPRRLSSHERTSDQGTQRSGSQQSARSNRAKELLQPPKPSGLERDQPAPGLSEKPSAAVDGDKHSTLADTGSGQDVDMQDVGQQEHPVNGRESTSMSTSPLEPGRTRMYLEQQGPTDDIERFLEANLYSLSDAPEAKMVPSPSESRDVATKPNDGLHEFEQIESTERKQESAPQMDDHIDSLFVENESNALDVMNSDAAPEQGHDFDVPGFNQDSHIDSLFVGDEPGFQDAGALNEALDRQSEMTVHGLDRQDKNHSQIAGSVCDSSEIADHYTAPEPDPRGSLRRGVHEVYTPGGLASRDSQDVDGQSTSSTTQQISPSLHQHQQQQQQFGMLPPKQREGSRQISESSIQQGVPSPQFTGPDPRSETPNNLFGLNDASKLPALEPGHINLDFLQPSRNVQADEHSDDEMRSKRARVRELEEQKAARDHEAAKQKAREDLNTRLKQLEKEAEGANAAKAPKEVKKSPEANPLEKRTSEDMTEKELQHLKHLMSLASTAEGEAHDGSGTSSESRERGLDPAQGQKQQTKRQQTSQTKPRIGRPPKRNGDGVVRKIARQVSEETKAKDARRIACQAFRNQDIFKNALGPQTPGDSGKTVTTETLRTGEHEVKPKSSKKKPLGPNSAHQATEEDRLLMYLRTVGDKKPSWDDTCTRLEQMTGRRASKDSLRKRFTRLKRTYAHLSHPQDPSDVKHNSTASSSMSAAGSQSPMPIGNTRTSSSGPSEPSQSTSNLAASATSAQSPEHVPPHPTTGGKSLTPAVTKSIMAQIEMDKIFQAEASETSDEEYESSEAGERQASPTTPTDYCHYGYRVVRTLERAGDQEQISEPVICGPTFSSIRQANQAAGAEFLKERGPIEVWPLTSHSWRLDDLGLAHWQGESRDGSVFEVFVERFLRSFHQGIEPESKDGWLGRRVFVIFKEIATPKSIADMPSGVSNGAKTNGGSTGNETFDGLFEEVPEVGGIKNNTDEGVKHLVRCSHPDQEDGMKNMHGASSVQTILKSVTAVEGVFTARGMANNRARDVYWGLRQAERPQSARYDVVNSFLAHKRALDEEVRELNAADENFAKTLETGQSITAVYVGETELLGPRNI